MSVLDAADPIEALEMTWKHVGVHVQRWNCSRCGFATQAEADLTVAYITARLAYDSLQDGRVSESLTLCKYASLLLTHIVGPPLPSTQRDLSVSLQNVLQRMEELIAILRGASTSSTAGKSAGTCATETSSRPPLSVLDATFFQARLQTR